MKCILRFRSRSDSIVRPKGQNGNPAKRVKITSTESRRRTRCHLVQIEKVQFFCCSNASEDTELRDREKCRRNLKFSNKFNAARIYRRQSASARTRKQYHSQRVSLFMLIAYCDLTLRIM